MGQGVYTAISMILAEELDADFGKVELEHAPPNEKLYTNPLLGIQATGNSNSIRAFWKPLRQAGAAARAMLVQAAARRWQVDPASCTAANSVVTHAASGRSLGYGDLVDAAADLPVPQDPPLKDPKDFTLIGKPLKRLDTPKQDQWRGDLRHRRHASRDEIRNARRLSGFGRQGREGRRQRSQGGSRRAADRRARRSCRGRRRSHVGRQEGSRRAQDHLGRRPQRQDQFGRHLGGSARREQEGRRRREIGRRHRQGIGARRKVRRRI